MHATIAKLAFIALLALPARATVFTTFTVNDLGDASDGNAGDGVCRTAGNVCTLRAAIEEVNALSTPHGIVFSVAGTITPATAYPPIVRIISIDGRPAPGYDNDPRPVVTINGGRTLARGFDFAAGSDDSELWAVRLYGFTDTAVSISSANVLLSACHFGPIGGGTPNGDGVHLQASSNAAEIGGSGFGVRNDNVISGNIRNGIRVEGSNHTILNNWIGIDATGMNVLPNGGDGIYIAGNAQGICVGGTGNRRGESVISGNGGNGVTVDGSSGNVIVGTIGLNVSGSNAMPNAGDGVALMNGANDNQIGTVYNSSLIAGNAGNGISIASSCNRTKILSCMVGVEVGSTGAVIGNGIHGISDAGTGTVIGGEFANGIFGNTLDGIHLGPTAVGTRIGSSFIGAFYHYFYAGNRRYGIGIDGATNVTISGMFSYDGNVIGANGSDGIHITGAVTATIDHNEISTSAGAGVLVEGGAARVTITANSIDANGGPGIDLGGDGVTPNDTRDADGGPNGRQNYPVITSVLGTATQTIVQGTLNSTPNGTFALHFYSSVTADPSGFGEGATYLGTTDVLTGNSGNAAFLFVTGATTGVITATATGANGTSELSAARPVTPSSIQFALPVYIAGENAGAGIITVTRTGDLSATSTVQYATADHTATHPADYTLTTGTLTFAPGVASETFSIPIVNDGIPEQGETLMLMLANPTAAFLGTPVVSSLTIEDYYPSANLSITKTAGSLTFAAGQQITYTIRVANAGPDPATNVIVTDVLPSGSTFVSTTSATFHCAGTTTITCTAASLAAGAFADIALVVTATGNQPIANSASVAAKVSDPVPTNNSASAAAVVPVTMIPTLSELTLFALAIAIAAFAAAKLR
jgi:uncharacterized repeat protein (TIGR01451 family)/CSLREA domain-containing protein